MRRQTTQFAGGYNVHARLCVCDDKGLSVHTRVDLVIFPGQAEQSFLFIWN